MGGAAEDGQHAAAAPGAAPPAAVPCLSGHASCPFSFGTNGSGCCPLDDAGAVCCQTPLPAGLVRSYCCPKGSGCSTHGCTPTRDAYLCGPNQGTNCSVAALCSSGPRDWTAAGGGKPAVLVVGDSVSIGWTPVLQSLITTTHTVAHSPGRMADGGARSTSNFAACADYLLSTDTLQPLPLKRGDTILMNFGLHDFNLGLAGVEEYSSELTAGIKRTLKILPQGAKLAFVGTTPAHNTASPADDVTVQGLNAAARRICTSLGNPHDYC